MTNCNPYGVFEVVNEELVLYAEHANMATAEDHRDALRAANPGFNFTVQGNCHCRQRHN